MKFVPHLLIVLALVYMFSKQYSQFRVTDTLQAKAKFQNFTIGFIVLTAVLIWSWV